MPNGITLISKYKLISTNYSPEEIADIAKLTNIQEDVYNIVYVSWTTLVSESVTNYYLEELC